MPASIHRFAIIITILLLSGIHVSQAQDSYYIEDPHISFDGGIIFGTNFTQVDGDTYWGYHKVGLNTGGTVYIHFTPKIGVSMEMLYSEKGSRAASADMSQALGLYIMQYHINLNYIEIPLTFHLKEKVMIYEKKREMDFELGASYARLISYSEWAETDQPVLINHDINWFNSVDINYVVGASVKLLKNFYINARYQYSAVKIRSADRVPLGFSYGDGQYNNVCVLRLMYYFSHQQNG